MSTPRRCDICQAPALTRVVDAETGNPIERVPEFDDMPILDTVRPVTVIQERFCRLHRKKTMKAMEQSCYLEEDVRRPYITSDMTDAEPAPVAVVTDNFLREHPHDGADVLGGDEDE